MKRSVFALIMTFALLFGAGGLLLAGSRSAGGSQSLALAASLPDSDGVVAMDMQRLIKEVLPQISASGKVQFLNDLTAQLDAVKNQTGIDLRDFQQVAVGVKFKEIAPGKVDYEPLILARGNSTMKSGSLLTAAKLASKGKYREQKSGAKTIYIFAAKEIMEANKPQSPTPKQEEDFNRTLGRIPAEIAAAAFDDNTLVIGVPARVVETLEGKSRVGQNILSLVGRNAGAIISFGAKMPPNASRFFQLDNDEIGKNIDSIEQASGAVNLTDGNATVSLAAKTFQPPQAKDLQDTLEFLRSIGTSFLGSSQGADKQIYARMVQSAKIAREGSEVTLNMQISNSDLSTLLGSK